MSLNKPKYEPTPKENAYLEMILARLKYLRIDAEEQGRKLYYENQQETAKSVCLNLKIKEMIFQLVIGKTQTGKTACMLAIIEMCLNDIANVINPENVYIITGLSSNDWKEQTIDRVPKEVTVLHRNDLKK